jgi:hypothetical protein
MVMAAVHAARLAGICQRAVVASRRSMRTLLDRATGRTQAAPRSLRPVIVPSSLGDLHGPESGVVELPVELYWSGSAEFDLADPQQAAAMYDAVLDTASTADVLSRYLNAGVLIRVWPVLGMTRAKRNEWETRFPELRRQRIAAAA